MNKTSPNSNRTSPCFISQNKKAQMEMVGLVIIVILITLGMLFMAIFALQQDPSKKIFTRKGLATSSATALLKTNVICTQQDGSIVNPSLGKDILEDCANNYNNPQGCIIYSCHNKYNPQNTHCCQFFQDTAAQLLNDTLGKWNKRYELNINLIYKSATPISLSQIKTRGGCPKNRPRDSSGLNPISTDSGGLIETVLYLCD